MERKHVCRRCEEISLTQSAFLSRKRPFAIGGAAPHYAPDLPFRVESLLLDVTVDPRSKVVQGMTRQRVRAVSPGQKRIRLDQVGLRIEEARLNGKPVGFSIEGHSLLLELESAYPHGPSTGEMLEYEIRYRAENPRRGLYFTGPDDFYPEKRYQVWSQGQDEDNRHWFPCFDYPNQKALSEVIATVPQGFTAVSNGALVSKQDVTEGAMKGGARYHYRLGTPHVGYLICLTVAELSEWSDPGPRGLPVQYYVEPGREEDGKRAFGNTPRMIEVFEAKTGAPYPYEKYSQVAVQDFIFGGMENTSATTQTDLALFDARAEIDFSSDPLVSHELAHQWFGDLLTCRDWSHGWLNEGFATFMERVWIESNPGKGGGADEAKYYSYDDLRRYQEQDAVNYRRPIVCNTYVEPIDLFDTHLYEKGGLVLNLIRSILGEESFWKSIHLYVTRHRGQSVETLDLIRAIEDATGRNLRRVFDEWVFMAGYPEFELSYSWHEEKKLVELVIEQKQTQGQPSVTAEGATTPLFHLPVKLELTLEGGQKVSQTLEIGEARERVFLSASSKPLMVRFDPESTIPKSLKFPRPKEMLLYQLRQDPDCMGRIEAAHELAKIADLEVVDALGASALADPFWGVQAESAQALASLRMDAARDALIRALQAKEPKARRVVIKALGTFRDEKAAQALRKSAEGDESYFVEAEAVRAFALSRLSPISLLPRAKAEEIEEFLLSRLEKESYRQVIRAMALRSLADLPGIGRGERPRALQALLDWSERGKPMDARGAAVLALGVVVRSSVPSERARIMEALAHLAAEDNFRMRLAVIHALHESASPEAIALLRRIREIDADGRVKRHALFAADALELSGGVPQSVSQLKESLDQLQEEYRKLRTLVEDVKANKA